MKSVDAEEPLLVFCKSSCWYPFEFPVICSKTPVSEKAGLFNFNDPEKVGEANGANKFKAVCKSV